MSTFTESIAGHYVSGDSADVLSAIRTSGINLAVWERPRNEACQSAIKRLLSHRSGVQIDLNPMHEGELVNCFRQFAGLRVNKSAFHALAIDIQFLVSRFCEIADTNHARVRFERIEGDGCRLFHADNLHLRMLCTYAGPGTEWVENKHLSYEELGLRGRTLEETNAAIVKNSSQIRRLEPWSVAVFSGAQRENTAPLVHRSAPVPTRKEYRIRLCIDMPDACGC